MTNRIFYEPTKEQVAHTAASKLLVEDPRMDSWVFFLTGYFWPATARAVDALQRWPGSQNPKEVGVSLQKGRKTSWFAEIAATDRRIESFRQYIEIIVRWNHVSDHALTVLGIAPPELYINPLVLYYFIYFRQLLI
jgi:hypothetical protein